MVGHLPQLGDTCRDVYAPYMRHRDRVLTYLGLQIITISRLLVAPSFGCVGIVLRIYRVRPPLP